MILKSRACSTAKSNTAIRSTARIKSIDTSAAKKLPGVKLVITGDDIPDMPIGFMKDNMPLKKGKVRQFRDEIAAVAATDPDIAGRSR